jgi:hypothetical protein
MQYYDHGCMLMSDFLTGREEIQVVFITTGALLAPGWHRTGTSEME